MSEEIIPFVQRFGFEETKPIFNDFPEKGRVALIYFFHDLVNKGFLEGDRTYDIWNNFLSELHRTCRFIDESFYHSDQGFDYIDHLSIVLSGAKWVQIFSLCERIYNKLLVETGYIDEESHDGSNFIPIEGVWVALTTLDQVKKYYTKEINTILGEENIGYYFVDGQFQRRGRAQTQKSIQRVSSVLGRERFRDVRSHYNKSRKFFENFPDPDVQNCVKEALLALEACLSIVTGTPVSNNFSKVVKQFMGKENSDIPYPIGEGMIKLHAYRGSGKGVAHAATKGNKVTEIDAELVLSLTAAYITYLIDLFPVDKEDEIPF